MIDGVLCTNQYVVLKIKPMYGTRINGINSLQNTIESTIGMKSLMNVMYKKGIYWNFTSNPSIYKEERKIKILSLMSNQW